jgi:hypothetical protein
MWEWCPLAKVRPFQFICRLPIMFLKKENPNAFIFNGIDGQYSDRSPMPMYEMTSSHRRLAVETLERFAHKKLAREAGDL